jgi:hypothetical protein
VRPSLPVRARCTRELNFCRSLSRSRATVSHRASTSAPGLRNAPEPGLLQGCVVEDSLQTPVCDKLYQCPAIVDRATSVPCSVSCNVVYSIKLSIGKVIRTRAYCPQPWPSASPTISPPMITYSCMDKIRAANLSQACHAAQFAVPSSTFRQ